MILFFDTETTGKYEFNFPPESHSQPHIVQLAAILADDDGKEIASMSAVIEPSGWIIPIEASNIHGITTERARQVGISLESALPVFFELKRRASVCVGHNIDFDKAVVRSVALRNFDDDPEWPESFCTMHATTDICKLPNQHGYANYKWPKLIEAYRHLFGEEFDGAHDALADVRACARIYFHLKEAQREVAA